MHENVLITKPHGTINVYNRVKQTPSHLKKPKKLKDADSPCNKEGHEIWLKASETQSGVWWDLFLSNSSLQGQ